MYSTHYLLDNLTFIVQQELPLFTRFFMMSIFGQFYLLTNVLYDIYNVQTCTYKPGRMFVHEVVDTSV